MPDQYTPLQALAAFWAKVNTHSGKFWNGTECWEWTASQSRRGYGLIKVRGTTGRTKTTYAHRHAYALAHGPIPDGLQVCHHCDNKLCVRDEHRFLGTPGDNSRDMVAKGRSTKGERNPRAKLTAERVAAIRTMYATGQYSSRVVGLTFGVHATTVRNIVRRQNWPE
jgi:hypothetical protein